MSGDGPIMNTIPSAPEPTLPVTRNSNFCENDDAPAESAISIGVSQNTDECSFKDDRNTRSDA